MRGLAVYALLCFFAVVAALVAARALAAPAYVAPLSEQCPVLYITFENGWTFAAGNSKCSIT